MEIEIVKGDILELNVDAIVNPANSLGFMGGGVALAIREKGGIGIEEEAVEKSPIPLGFAQATGAGKLECKWIIHAPTMEQPAGESSLEKVRLATEAALQCAHELQVSSIAFPGMGTGVGGLDVEKVAAVMLDVIVNFESEYVKHVVLCAFSDPLFQAFQKIWNA